MANIDINEDKTLSAEELEQVKGGLLLPAVQKVREAAVTPPTAGGLMHIRKAGGEKEL
jgi:hypothetical protein